jgi:hypothetical protein
MRLRSIMTAAAVLILTLGVGLSQAQQAFTSTTAPPLTVRLSVVAAPGVPATVALRNGEMGRWTRGDGVQYGLTPVVADGVATLYVFQITPGESPGTERIKQIGKRKLVQGESVSVPKSGPAVHDHTPRDRTGTVEMTVGAPGGGGQPQPHGTNVRMPTPRINQSSEKMTP